MMIVMMTAKEGDPKEDVVVDKAGLNIRANYNLGVLFGDPQVGN
jgi:hypothetical protein